MSGVAELGDMAVLDIDMLHKAAVSCVITIPRSYEKVNNVSKGFRGFVNPNPKIGPADDKNALKPPF